MVDRSTSPGALWLAGCACAVLGGCSWNWDTRSVAVVFSYDGATDTWIDRGDPTRVHPLSSSIQVSDAASGLLRWDVSAFPTGEAVTAASIILFMTNVTAEEYSVVEVKRDWIDAEATWNEFALGQPWQIAGGLGEADRGALSLASVAPRTTQAPYVIELGAEGIALVQSWIDDPVNNHGVLITDLTARNSDGIDFDSRDTPEDPSRRPALHVVYETGAGGG